MNESLWAAVSFGFLGSLHCVGMCGGLIGALTMGRLNLWQAGIFIYQLGRIFTYAMLGLTVGLIGMGLDEIGGDLLQRILAVVAGLFMIGFGLNMTGFFQKVFQTIRWPNPLRRLSSAAINFLKISKHTQALIKKPNLFKWFTVGIINGLLPCGLVYAALAMALASEYTSTAVYIMIFFGLGTIPAMTVAPAILRSMSPAIRGNLLRGAGILLILYGVFTGLRGSQLLPFLHNHSRMPNSNPQSEYCRANEFHFKK